MFNTNTIFHPYSVFHYLAKPELCANAAEFIYKGLDQGQLFPEVDKVFPMEGYIDAWDYMRSERSTHGKVLVETAYQA
jgi:NADPH:quinone reductase-like Zn-dependent oxidoreductase